MFLILTNAVKTLSNADAGLKVNKLMCDVLMVTLIVFGVVMCCVCR